MKNIHTEEDFFNKIYGDTCIGLKRFIQRKSRDPTMVDDILQEVYIEVFRHLKELKAHENIIGWIYKTADNKTKKLNKVYNRHLIREVAMEEWNGTIEDDCVLEIIRLEEYKAVLKEDEFVLLMLKYNDGYSHKEVAQITGITEGSSKMKLSRIVKKLRKNITILIQNNK
mgnify:CR=1 FL=1